MADPASAYLEGVRISDERKARAEEALYRQQEQEAIAARAAQEAQVRQQSLRLRQQQLEAQAQTAAQRFNAQRQYQQFVAAGGDPVQAILKFGPAMGQGTSLGAAIRAQQMQQPKAPPQIQMQPGPNGTKIPLLMQNGRASVVPANAYQPRPEPEQWTEATRQINGQDVPGQLSSRSGRFIPYPASEQAGSVSPQKRLQISLAEKKKASLQKTLGDETQLFALAKARAKGKTPTHADLEAVEADIQKQMDDIDSQLDQSVGKKTEVKEPEAGAGTATETSGKKQTLKFIRDKDGNLVLSSSDADNSGN